MGELALFLDCLVVLFMVFLVCTDSVSLTIFALVVIIFNILLMATLYS